MKNKILFISRILVAGLIIYSIVSFKDILNKSNSYPLESLYYTDYKYDIDELLGNDDGKNQVILMLTTHALKLGHYKTIVYNDDFSEKLFNRYLEYIDYAKKYLLKTDVDLLSTYKYQLDDQINTLNFEFFDIAYELIVQRQKETEQIVRRYLSMPFDYTKDEVLDLDPDHRDFPENEAAREEFWRKFLKASVLEQLAVEIEIQKEAKQKHDTAVRHKTFEQIEEDVRKKILDNYENLFYRQHELTKDDYFAGYLNAVTSLYDPHTQYMAPKIKKDFDIYMAGQFEGIGATLQANKGLIKVVKIIPGSACWRQGELEVNDIIIKVGQGDEEPVSVVGMRLDDAVQLIRGKKGTTVKLTVKKPDGTIKVIPIVRDVVILEESYAKSIIIKDGNKKYGLIYLPQFYSSFKKNGRTCYVDVRNEIEKLKMDNVDGIIFDLRNNGGGSLFDVINIAGFFIESGPVVQVRDRRGVSQVLNDTDKKIVFDKPLLILINENSASASEIFAAAMQDYHRAVVVGTTSHGKGTVQNAFDLSRLLPKKNQNDLGPLGSLKMTVQKFYRINGYTTQLVGVKPDITLPDTYMFLDIGEKDLPNALKADSIESLKYDLWKPHYNIKQIRKHTKNRVQNSDEFKLIAERAKILKERYDDKKMILNFDKYMADLEKKKQENKKFDKLSKFTNSLNFKFLSSDTEIFSTDTVLKASYKDWKKRLTKDVYIPEAVNIMREMVR